MTADQYKAALAKLGINQREAADLMGVSLRTSNAYACGAPIPGPVAVLLSLMISRKIPVNAAASTAKPARK